MKRLLFVLLMLLNPGFSSLQSEAEARSPASSKSLSRKEIISELKKRELAYREFYQEQIRKLKELMKDLAFLSQIEADLMLAERDLGDEKSPVPRLQRFQIVDRSMKLIYARMAILDQRFKEQDPAVYEQFTELRERLQKANGKFLEIQSIIDILMTEEDISRLRSLEIPQIEKAKERRLLNRASFERQLAILEDTASQASTDLNYLVWSKVQRRLNEVLRTPRDFNLDAEEVLALQRNFRRHEVKLESARLRIVSDFQKMDCPEFHVKNENIKTLSLELSRILSLSEPSPAQLELAEVLLLNIARRCVVAREASRDQAEIRWRRENFTFAKMSHETVDFIKVSHRDPGFEDAESADGDPNGKNSESSESRNYGPAVTISSDGTRATITSYHGEFRQEIVVDLQKDVSSELADELFERAGMKMKVDRVNRSDRETLAQVEIPADLSNMPDFRETLQQDSQRLDLQHDLDRFSSKAASVDSAIASLSKSLANEMRAGEQQLNNWINEAYRTFSGQSPFGSVAGISFEDIKGSSAAGNYDGPFQDSYQDIEALMSVNRRLQEELDSNPINSKSAPPLRDMLEASNELAKLAEEALRSGDLAQSQNLMELAKQVTSAAGPAILRGGIGFLPFVGDVADITEAITGRDMITGDPLSIAERGMAMAGIVIGSRVVWEKVGGGLGEVIRSGKLYSQGVSKARRYDALSPGPLHTMEILGEGEYLQHGLEESLNAGDQFIRGLYGKSVAATFRGGKYTMLTLTEEITLYRVHGRSATRNHGSYWTRQVPNTGERSKIDSALDLSYGNDAEVITAIRVPPGTVIYEGIVAPQSKSLGVGSIIGERVGGGPQIFIKEVPEDWVIKD